MSIAKTGTTFATSGAAYAARSASHAARSAACAATTAAFAAMILAASPSLAGNIPLSCQSTKHKEAGNLDKCLEGAQAKLLATGDTASFDAAVTKCTDKFTAKWTDAEQKASEQGGACPTTGDEAVVRSFVQSRVACIANALETGDKACLLCGNGAVDEGEDCDLAANGSGTCSTATGGASPVGEVSCAAGCVFDTSACTTSVTVAGSQWYLGAPDASCTATCAAYGKVYDTATLTYAGSSGTDANCKTVLNAMGRPGSVISAGSGMGAGCVTPQSSSTPGLAGLRVTDPTTADATLPPGSGFLRVCACL